MFKVRTVDDSRKARVRGDTCAEFARSRSIPRPTLQNWECKYARLLRESRRHPRVSSYLPPVPSRESCLTFSGSGRKADTAPIEGTLCIFIIDERGLEHIVTIDTIVKTATELMPIVMGPKNREAKQSWCQCFIRRNHPTIRRICHSGRKTRDELEELCLPFVEQVAEVAKDGALFNMDQISVYWDMGPRTTVEFVGAHTVRSTTAESEGYQCTMALTVSADGIMFPLILSIMGCPAAMWRRIAFGPDFAQLVSKLGKLRLPMLLPVLLYVPGGCTAVAQALGVGVMGPVKKHIWQLNSRSPGRPRSNNAVGSTDIIQDATV
ncbi:hypothetical protein GQ600_12583 [Phytophthora cactorum]|nr:hypothetical protein GQ600_12583 [Phytophthora cactorum]